MTCVTAHYAYTGVGRDPAQSGSDSLKFEFTARHIRSACHVHSYTREVWRSNAFKSLDSSSTSLLGWRNMATRPEEIRPGLAEPKW